ncbi:MAG: hypothetical protein CMH57_15360 [Myxococcales bacterium]|nr:hypothetical protein [Myxococcales bacterium]
MAPPSLNHHLAELRRVLFALRDRGVDPNELQLALRYANAHLEPLGLSLVERQRLDALEALADAALEHAFLRWEEPAMAEAANRDLWEVCDRLRERVPDLGPRRPAEAPPVVHAEDDSSPVVCVSWLGLEVTFPARDGVAGLRERLSWVVVEVDGAPWVRLYCDHDLSQEFRAEPGRSWRPTDAMALRWWVEAPGG